ncbi:carbohydrate kinase family protein [Candidatus Kaiserbacteria bacterium]|nr:carbohydrate kinase family protein [Candidatus Kaiserbacteria bacterium]
MKYDMVSFGDITTDAFIRLKDAHVNCKINNEDCEICMKFGTKIPFESVTEVLAVGNGPNAAVAVARLGLSSALVAHIGGDMNGESCLNALKERGVALEYVEKHPEMRTNYHYILQYGAERTILIKHELYPYKLPNFSEPPSWFYMTSLPEETLDYQLDIARYAAKNGVKLAFQPGTYQMKLGTQKMAEVYAASEIFFCNKEESQLILGTKEEDIKKLLAGIQALGPKIPVITDGRDGSYVLEEGVAYHVPMYPDPAPPVSRTGAGDATAATTVAYIIKGLSPKDALMRGTINAAAGVQAVHVQLGTLTADKIEEWYAKRPADFVATKI